jgi:hypothetical protein
MGQNENFEALWDRIVFPLAFIVVGGIALAIYFENKQDNRELESLRTNGVTTTGSLSPNYKYRDAWGRTEYELTYTFAGNGQTYSKTVTVDQRPEYSDVKVVYLSGDPNVSRLFDFSHRTHWEDVLYAAIIAGILIAIRLAWWWGRNFYYRLRS